MKAFALGLLTLVIGVSAQASKNDLLKIQCSSEDNHTTVSTSIGTKDGSGRMTLSFEQPGGDIIMLGSVSVEAEPAQPEPNQQRIGLASKARNFALLIPQDAHNRRFFSAVLSTGVDAERASESMGSEPWAVRKDILMTCSMKKVAL